MPCTGWCGAGYGTRWVYGVGIRVGIPGSTQPSSCPREEVPSTAKRAPEPPCRGGGVGGTGDWTRDPGVRWAGRYIPTLRARSVPCRALPGIYLRIAHLRPIWRELTSYPGNLVKTAKCRRKVSKRPVIVPICQNGVGKSPLEIPRFPKVAAFSPKELMVPFDP